jgi:hypothetical protein
MDLFYSSELHQYRHGDPVTGQILPGCTSIINAPKDFINEDDLIRGSRRHKAIELFIKCVLDEDTLAEEYKPYLEGYKLFALETGFVCTGSEIIVHSDTYLFAATIDLWGKFPCDTVDSIGDIKTGSYPSWCPVQTGSHALCIKQYVKRFGLHLKADGKYKLHQHNDRQNGNEFLALLNAKRVRDKYNI